MPKQVITIEQATKVRNWVAKFANQNNSQRALTIERDALAEREERNEALKLLIEAGLDVSAALATLKYAMEAQPEKAPTWSDKINAAKAMIDFARYLIPPEPPAVKSETTQKMTVSFEDCSDEEIKFFLEFGSLPTPENLARLKALRDQPAQLSSHTSEGTEIVPE